MLDGNSGRLSSGMIGLAVTVILTLLALKASRKAIRVAEDTGRRQLRAYVSIDTASIGAVVAGQHLSATIRIKNSGQTPAYKVGVHTAMGWHKVPPSEEWFDLQSTRPLESVLGPGQPAFAYPKMENGRNSFKLDLILARLPSTFGAWCVMSIASISSDT